MLGFLLEIEEFKRYEYFQHNRAKWTFPSAAVDNRKNDVVRSDINVQRVVAVLGNGAMVAFQNP
jgi:hypothetical protein